MTTALWLAVPAALFAYLFLDGWRLKERCRRQLEDERLDRELVRLRALERVGREGVPMALLLDVVGDDELGELWWSEDGRLVHADHLTNNNGRRAA